MREMLRLGMIKRLVMVLLQELLMVGMMKQESYLVMLLLILQIMQRSQ
ncbi:hypothetical protein BCD_0966 (plasmid) [Borrelia crocidurae DOU]|uniref:Uncharacterized protein n=1 Tax=Borrelia crocidurae DOU TaxID=1293575 RepID=W5SJD3_9SPIR|nr:hypothetical protein BCD_0966 [Borrelia crocidurae DOU]